MSIEIENETPIDDPLETQRATIDGLASEFGDDDPYVIELRDELALSEAAQQEADRHIQRQQELDEEQKNRENGNNEPRKLLPILSVLANSDFTGGSAYAILRFDVPETEPETKTIKVGENSRPYTVVNLIPYGNNDHCRNSSLGAVETALNGTIEQIDRITEGGESAHGDVADYGTARLAIGDEAYTVRRLKLDVGGAERVPAYAIFARDQARGKGKEAERLLVLAQRTNAGEHDQLAASMAEVRAL